MKITPANKNKNNLILEGNLYKAIISLSLPIMLNNLISSLYSIGDAFWVSKIGDLPVAAVNFVWPVSFLTISFAMGISISGGAIISQYIGAKKYDEANETAQQLYVFAILFGICSLIIGWIFAPHILDLMNASDAMKATSRNYLRILFIEMPFLFMMNIFFSINQSQGDTLTPTLVNGSSAIFNIILDPLFIFVFNLGIEGAAIATVLSKVPFAIYGIYQMSHKLPNIKINPFSLKIVGPKMKELIRIGIPSSLGSSGMALGFVVLFSIISVYGDNTVAALGIGNRMNSLAFMPAVGIGAALSTIVGQNLGAQNIPRVKEAFNKSIVLALSFLAISTFILWYFSEALVMVFTTTPDIVEQGSNYLRILALTTLSISFFNCSIGLFNGSGHTRYSMFFEAGRLWLVRLPLIHLLTSTQLGIDGIWYAIGGSNVIAAIVAFTFTFFGAWKKPNLRKL